MSSKRLNQLFDALVDELNDQVKNGAEVIDKNSGEVVRISTPSATLNVARQFLRDLGVNASAQDHEGLGELVENLPFDTPSDKPLN